MERRGEGRWIFAAIALLVTTIVCVIVLTILVVNLTNVSSERDNLRAEVDKYKELTGSKSSEDLTGDLMAYNINFDNLYKAIESNLAPRYMSFARIRDLKTSEDGNYVVVNVQGYAGAYVSQGEYTVNTGLLSALYLYKEISGSEWKTSSFNGQTNTLCQDISKSEMKVFRGLTFGEDKAELTCEKDGKLIPISTAYYM